MALWCTIRTFAKHATELGNEQPPAPVFFVKPDNCMQRSGAIDVSGHPGEVHHEVELVVRMNHEGKPEAIAVGLDLTDRLTQGELRSEQLPWTKGKCFRGSAYVGPFSPWFNTWDYLLDTYEALHLELWVNEVLVQHAPVSEMTITPTMQIEDLMKWAPVQAGDLLFTGTPAGVGQLHPGDTVKAVLKKQEGVVVSEFSTKCV
ncbi:MAG TPA: hypothetical protein HA356_01995 [Candidatus Poseidoniaceae archaeon]|nr:MAG TPA: hypothetical protein D7H95_02015 [Candidatus Poseidoniales archaeon]HII10829.1 hypothetical protein [Candidatus Poseidoniaceae archaeon]|tara:strand:- start:2432 stop:3040 length:609 start_codon:yes stop_codon:yes gene_type:complete